MTTNEEQALGDELDELANELDPIDLATVLMMIFDADDPGQEFKDWIAQGIAADMIAWSQSNPDKAIPALIRIYDIEQEISNR